MAEASQTYDDILPNTGFDVVRGTTALVITDPQASKGLRAGAHRGIGANIVSEAVAS